MSKDRFLIISNHHRPIPFFDTTITRILNAGFNRIIIQNTGLYNWTNFSALNVQTVNLQCHTNYFNGMVQFSRTLSSNKDNFDYIVLVDNDLFLSDNKAFTEILFEVREKSYGWCGFYTHPHYYDNIPLEYSRLTADGPKQIIYSSQEEVPFLHSSPICPNNYPYPYWENALLVIRGDVWDRLTPEDWSHGRRTIKAVSEMDVPLGVFKAEFSSVRSDKSKRFGVTTYGDEWFHFGDLISFYYAIEEGNLTNVRLEDNRYTRARIGMFAACQELYGSDCFSKLVTKNLPAFYSRFGGKQKVLNDWCRLIEETPMENWTV